jgi:hypothetical protein
MWLIKARKRLRHESRWVPRWVAQYLAEAHGEERAIDVPYVPERTLARHQELLDLLLGLATYVRIDWYTYR